MLQKQTDWDLLFVWKNTEVDSETNSQVADILNYHETRKHKAGGGRCLFCDLLYAQGTVSACKSDCVSLYSLYFICHCKIDFLLLTNASSFLCQQENIYMRNGPYVKAHEFIRSFASGD